MENTEMTRSRSALTITTNVDDIISEDPYDNELTLTGDELFRAVQKVTSTNNGKDYTNEFKEFSKIGLEKPTEKLQEPKRHSRPTWSNVKKRIHQTLLKYMRKATWPMAKRVIKAAVAYWFAYVIDLIVPVMQAVGPCTFLAIVMVCYFQPSRTFGSLFESAGWGIIAACMATAWSLLGITISDAVREPGQMFDIWATIIHVSFLAVGTFVLSYDKIKWPPMRYGAISACIIMTFSLTQAYVKPDHKFYIMKSLLIPMLIGPACSLLVNILLWPEHATTNYIPYLHETLQSFIDLLDQETHFFLRDTYNRNTIAELHRTVQDNLANLDIAKREAQHEVSFSKIGPEDILEITRLVKSMHMTLGGLALSGVIEEELMKDGEEGTVEIRINGDDDSQSLADQASFSIDEPLSPTSTIGTIGNEEDLTRLLNILGPICTELSEACQLCLADCIARVDHLQHNCCEPWYYRLWPFKLKPRADHNKNVLDDPFGYLQEAIAKFNDSREEALTRLFNETHTISPSPQRLFLLLILFENSLNEVAESLGFLVGIVKVLSTTRQSKKFWLPVIPRLIRIRNFGEIDEDGWKIYEHKTREEEEEELGNEVFDPDVTPPSNSAQRFWYHLWRIRNWFDSKYAVFAFKNTLVVTCLCLPAFLPGSYEWFDVYRGQWAVVSAVLSFAPTTGGAVLQFLGRLLGVVMGAVMALIAWNMTNGNVYGLASVLFLFSLLLWFIYLNAKVWTVGGIIMLVNFPLVLANAYQASYGVGMHDDIYTIAAKRTTAVSIGITAAFVMNMIPWPHTGRVEVRHRLARTIADIGVLYSMTVSSLIKGDNNSDNLITTKPFRKLVARINRSIAIERLLLSRTIYEPPLRGNYPMEKYARMIDIVEHMVNLVSGMEYTLHGLNGTEWRVDLADVFNPSKCHYITHILTAFHILSTALENRVPLPPYNIISSTTTKFGHVCLGYRISRKIKKTATGLSKDDLETPAYACYCAYLIKTSHLTNELIKLVSVVKSLVGVNRYVKELIDF